MSVVLLFVLAALIVGVLAIPAGVAYLALRLRDQQLRSADPQLGFKAALHFLHTLAVVMVLTGASISVGDLFQGVVSGNPRKDVYEDDENRIRGRTPPATAGTGTYWNNPQRTATALGICGLGFLILFWLMLRSTNDRRYPIVRRLFTGFRTALSLLVVFLSITAIVLLCIQVKPDVATAEMLIGAALVWAGSAVVHLLLFRRVAKLPLEPADSSPVQ